MSLDLLGTAPSDLLDHVEPPQATHEQARQRAEIIRLGLVSYVHTREAIAQSYACRDWAALGYDSWEDYLEAEFDIRRLRLSVDERREAVAAYRIEGMSQPAIAAAVGVSQSTVRDDLAEVSRTTSLPLTVTGSDGKTYAATRPSAPDTTNVPAGREEPPAQGGPSSPVTGLHGRPGADASNVDAGGTPGGAVTRDADGPAPRPSPPKWDPAEREAHMAEVRRLDDIRSAQQQAKTLVPDVRALIFTVIQGSRQDKAALKDLITRDMIADLRRAVDLLEGEIDSEE